MERLHFEPENLLDRDPLPGQWEGERDYPGCTVSRTVGEREGVRTGLTVVTLKPGCEVQFDYDEGVTSVGIDTNGLLINTAKTRESWGRPLGISAEEAVVKSERGAVAFCPTNFGWQYGAFAVRNGNVLALPNDPHLTGVFSVIGMSDGVWTIEDVDMGKNTPKPDGSGLLDSMQIGLSLPLIVKEGKKVSRDEFIGDPRFRGDYRNTFDFGTAAAAPPPPEFWVLLRKVLPYSVASGRRLSRGDRVAVSEAGALTSEEVVTLSGLIRTLGLEEYLYVDEIRGRTRFAVLKPLPDVRMPAIGLGVKGGGLVCVAADGRQERMPGITVSDLADIMIEQGVEYGGLGSAGGDVAIVANEKDRACILNSPSNVEGGRLVTRLVPSLITIV